MTLIKVFTMLLIAYLWYEGGGKRAWMRDILVPIILALFLAVYLKTWWVFLSVGATAQMIRLGYGAFDPEHDDKPSLLASLTKDRSGEVIRAIWGLLVSVWIGSSLFFGGFLSGGGYLSFMLINVFINYCVCKFKLSVVPTDILVGLGVSCIILLLKP